jgi:glycerol-3-phosphate dehydrogenase
MRRTKGAHLVLPGLRGAQALLLGPGPDRRIVFLVPWYGRTLLGTTDTDFDGPAERARVEPQDRDYLLEQARRALRSPWTPDDVIAEFAGVRTLPSSGAAAPSAVPREWRLLAPRAGLLAPLGGKYTSARQDAAGIVDRALDLLRLPRRPCPTAGRPLPWCPRPPYAAWKAGAERRGVELGLSPDVASALAERHGARVSRLHERLAERPELARRLAPGAPFCMAEIVHALEDEMALTLDDLLRRRVPLLLVAPPGPELLDEISHLAARALGWSEDRRAAELALLAGRTAPSGARR